MKRFFYLITLLMLIASTASAQVKFGIKGGLNIAKASFNKEVLSSDNKAGFFVGPMVDVKVPGVGVGFDLALQYNNKKTKIDNGAESESVTVQKIEVPINLKWAFGNDKVFSVYAATGPQISWNVGSNSLKEIIGYNYNFKNCMFSWNVGAGFTIVKHFRVGYTYNIAVNETAVLTIPSMDDLSIKHKENSHQVFVAYLF